MKKVFLTSACLSLALLLFGQSKLSENTLQLDSLGIRDTVPLESMAWYAGRWVGKGFGAAVEETFSPPLGGTMIGTFRMVKENKPVFYEMLILEPDGHSLVYKVKHFNPDFNGWEEPEEFESFKLIKVDGNWFYFHGLTMFLEGNKLTHYLAMKQKDGTYGEAVLEYERNDNG